MLIKLWRTRFPIDSYNIYHSYFISLYIPIAFTLTISLSFPITFTLPISYPFPTRPHPYSSECLNGMLSRFWYTWHLKDPQSGYTPFYMTTPTLIHLLVNNQYHQVTCIATPPQSMKPCLLILVLFYIKCIMYM